MGGWLWYAFAMLAWITTLYTYERQARKQRDRIAVLTRRVDRAYEREAHLFKTADAAVASAVLISSIYPGGERHMGLLREALDTHDKACGDPECQDGQLARNLVDMLETTRDADGLVGQVVAILPPEEGEDGTEVH